MTSLDFKRGGGGGDGHDSTPADIHAPLPELAEATTSTTMLTMPPTESPPTYTPPTTVTYTLPSYVPPVPLSVLENELPTIEPWLPPSPPESMVAVETVTKQPW